jgi:hypothetical protein
MKDNLSRVGSILLWVAGLLGIGNYLVLTAYADVIRSSYRFVASPLVFRPLSVLNLVVGIALLVMALWRLASRPKQQ